MEINQFENMGLSSLSYEEEIFINGGHDGVAYQVGKAAGEVVKFVSTCAFVVVLFFTPKS